MLARVVEDWGGREDLWIFGYGSLIWRPDFEYIEHRRAKVHGWHRALKMWSRINRGTPECPGLVFALLSGGSCRGVVFRVPHTHARAILDALWEREMSMGVYDPRWLDCTTDAGRVKALAFTLSRRSPSYTGHLGDAEYRRIFAQSRGRYGTTHDYAHHTFHGLRQHGIHDRALAQLLKLVGS